MHRDGMATSPPSRTLDARLRVPGAEGGDWEEDASDWRAQQAAESKQSQAEQERLRQEYERRLAAMAAEEGDDDDAGADAGDDVGSGEDEEGAYRGEFKWDEAGLSQLQEVQKRCGELAGQLREKGKEVDRLTTMLEALEPVPGLDPSALLDVLHENGDVVDHDYRDVKIVTLAKKIRSLNVQLHKERAKSGKLANQVTRLQAQLRLEARGEQLSEAASAGASAGGDRSRRSPLSAKTRAAEGAEAAPDSPSTLANQNRALAAKAEELRTRLDAATAELKQTRRTLARELGTGELASAAAVAKAVEGGLGWRGRAEEITRLKAQTKRLQEQLRTAPAAAAASPADASVAAGGSMWSDGGASGGAGAGVGLSEVDVRARRDVTARAQRQSKSVDQLRVANEELQAAVEQQKQRVQAAKARVQTLEEEGKKAKSHVRTLLDKSRMDDKVVDALKAEVARLHDAMARLREQSNEEATRQATMARDDAAVERLRAEHREMQRNLADRDRAVRELTAALEAAKRPARPVSSRRSGRGGEGDPTLDVVRITQEARERGAEVELQRLREHCDVLRDKLQRAQAREDELRQQCSELERSCLELERCLGAAGGRRGGKAEARPSSALQQALDAKTEELALLRESCQRALRAKDQELATLRHTLAEQKQVFEEAMAQAEQAAAGAGGPGRVRRREGQ